MKFPRWVIALPVAVVALANAPAAAQCVTAPALEASAETAASGQTSEDSFGRIVAPVTVNGQGPFRFIVDTGANRSVVSRRLAERLGLPTTGEGIVHSVEGALSASLVSAESIRYGRLAVPSNEVPMLSGAMLAGEQGLLGVDGMQGRRLRLDFEQRCIEILPSAGAPSLGRGWTRIRGELRFGHLVIVRGRVNDLRVNVLIDTGSSLSLANRALQRALRTRAGRSFTGVRYSRAHTAGEPIVLEHGVIVPRMTMGELEITNLPLYVDDYHIFSLWGLLDQPTVLVGMNVLTQARAMAIDYPHATVYFQFRN